jgi:hypothetical protein
MQLSGYLSGSFFPGEQLLSDPAGLWMEMILATGTTLCFGTVIRIGNLAIIVS